MGNHFIVHRLDSPPATTPAPSRIVQEDEAATRARMVENMKRAGDPAWTYDHAAKAPPGAYAPASPLPEVSRHDQSFGSINQMGRAQNV
jgi:hypothetical protein